MKTTIKSILSGILLLSTTVGFSQNELHQSEKTNQAVKSKEAKNIEIAQKFVDQVINGQKVELIENFWAPDMI